MICKAHKAIFLGAVSGLGVLGAIWGALSVPVSAQQSEPALNKALVEAQEAIARGDGIAAEIAGKRALDEGVERSAVAALIGEGELLQEDFRDARHWLGSGEFDDGNWTRGFHALARLEMAEGNYEGAALAFDRVIEREEGGPHLWVDIGRMRYSAGLHHSALDAALQAVSRDPKNARALEFRAQLVRDSDGLATALPWLERALDVAPDDMGILAEYAATLGDMGRAKDMLTVARRMVQINPRDARPYYFQAVLAARAGEDALARRLMWRTNGEFDERPSGLLLNGILEMRSGNAALAVENFDRLTRMQPYNRSARLMLGRALLANGEANELVARLSELASRSDASAYLLTLLGRAHEQMGRRDLAAPFLDRAVNPDFKGVAAIPPKADFRSYSRSYTGNAFSGDRVTRLRALLAEGRMGEAQEQARAFNREHPQSVDVQVLAGDVELLAGNTTGAFFAYQQAARIRRQWPLTQRMVTALRLMDRADQAELILVQFLRKNPRSPHAAAMLGLARARAGDDAQAAVLLAHAAEIGAYGRDPWHLSRLADVELRSGNQQAAEAAAWRSFAIARNSGAVAATLARVIGAGGDLSGTAGSAQAQRDILLEKATSLSTI